MSKQVEIQCLAKLHEKTHCFHEIMDFLISEKALSAQVGSTFRNELAHEQVYVLHHTLKTALQEERLQLVDYSWQLLPKETICITIVTKLSRRDFTWGIL